MISPLQGVVSLVGGWERGRLLHVGDFALALSSARVIGRLTTADGAEILIRNRHVDKTELLPATRSEPWGLLLRHGAVRQKGRWSSQIDPRGYETEVRGEKAAAVARDILPRLNRHGASGTEVSDAVQLLERFPDADALFARTAAIAGKARFINPDERSTLLSLRPEHRLALEMASQEELERGVLEGELQALEEAWREAEEIAAIADNMFLPAAVSDRLAELKERLRVR
jgi:hypothetical protein